MSKLNYCEWSLPDVTRKHDVDSLAYDELDTPHNHSVALIAVLWTQALTDFGLTQADIDQDESGIYYPVIENLRDCCAARGANNYFNQMLNTIENNEPDFDEYAYDAWSDARAE